MRAEDDAAKGRNGGFANVELLFDEEGDEHEEGGEAADDEVGPVRLVDGELFPHCGGCVREREKRRRRRSDGAFSLLPRRPQSSPRPWGPNCSPLLFQQPHQTRAPHNQSFSYLHFPSNRPNSLRTIRTCSLLFSRLLYKSLKRMSFLPLSGSEECACSTSCVFLTMSSFCSRTGEA